MTTFDERDKAFENKFAHDNELAFKVQARTSKLVGLWAASKMGKNAGDAENYAASLVQANLSIESGKLAERLQKDLTSAGITVPLEEINATIVRQTALARSQLAGQ